MGANDKAIGYLELNSKQFDDALAAAQKALVAFAGVLASYKVADFFKDGIDAAIKFGNEAYFAAQKLNGYDPGKLFLVQKALEQGGMAAAEARGEIEEFGRAGRPLETLFKGGQGGFADALTRASREYGTQAKILSESAEKFAYVQYQLTSVGTKLQGFFLGLADKVIGPLSALLDQIDQVDLVGKGEQFGEYVSDAISTIRGLIINGDIWQVPGLAIRVGFEMAVDYLMQTSTWTGVVKVAVGALALIGNFLTTIFLGIGKLLVATIEAAFERLRSKYGYILDIVSPAFAIADHFAKHASTDVGVNLANEENNSLIQSQESGADQINAKALATAMSGINDLLKSGKGVNLSNPDQTKLSTLISKAFTTGQASSGGRAGQINPLFSERADPFHVIADSLAKVGGGGRYVRTGLSIAEKAAMDSLRFQKQVADNTKIIADAAKRAWKGVPYSMAGG